MIQNYTVEMTRLVFLLIPGLLLVQPPQRRFEVASVKPLDATLADLLRTNYRSVSITDSRVDLKGQTLAELVALAWRITQDRVMNVPDSVRTLFFDVQALVPEGASKDAVPEMMQALPVEKFKLSAHTAEENRSMYRMTVGKQTGKLQRSTADGPGKCAVEGDYRICHAMTMAEFATTLSQIDSRVIDCISCPSELR
jgi:uncharacterized protein (TIGR03435 family)